MRLLLLLTFLLPTRAFSQGLPLVDFGVNAVSLAKSRYAATRGQGVTICLKEQAPAPTDVDLRGRLLPTSLTSFITTLHATQMADILVGTGLSSPLNEGVAPAATLVPVNFNSLLPETETFYRNQHITVVNHSYGTDQENVYGAGAVAYDASTYQLPTLLHVFSAGNLGYTSHSSGPYANLPTVATLTGNFKMAKNSLVVGAIGPDGVVLPASSRGPAYDGRIKPELVAYSDDGTSAASALASGVAALLQQALRQQTGTDAPAALVKAILINSADERGQGINYQTGYGSINAFAAMNTAADKRYLEGAVAATDVFSTTISVPTAQRLKVTLAWTDPPAALNSPKALVNDLDLTLSDGRSTWKPWVLNPTPNLDSLSKRPVRMRDTLNNVEQITLDVPAAGIYTIRVSGARVAGQQPFALAYGWDTPGIFYWVTPNLATPIISDTTLTIRWKNTTPTRYGTLEFSPDRGSSWKLVRDSIVLATGFFSWQTPDLLTTGQLRMRLAGGVYASDTFRLSPIPALTIRYACADSVGLAWTTLVGGKAPARHVLYRLSSQATSWEKMRIVTGNSTVVNGVRPGDAWAVAPVANDGNAGIRSDLVDRQQVACYYRSLTAILVDSLVQVMGELSTTGGVSRVTFQKQTTQGLTDLGSQAVTPANLTYTFTDSLLQEGPNTYRMRILLATGAVVYSDFATAFVLRQAPVLLYPNPVENGQSLTIRAGDYQPYTLQLTDVMGRMIRTYDVPSNEATLSTTGLPPGLYLYAIFREDRRMQAGKLLIN